MYDPKKAEEYRARAAEMLINAQRVTNPEQRQIMLNIAAMYHRLAKCAEDEP